MSRVGRLVRVIRVMRVARLYKLVNRWRKKKKEEEEFTFSASVIGTKMADVITQKVIVCVMLMCALVPFSTA